MTEAQGSTPEPERKRRTRKPAPPAQKKMESDVRFSDEYDDSLRVSYSLKLHPDLLRQLKGIVLRARMTGQPKGIKTIAGVFEEALARYVDTVKRVDGLEIPLPYEDHKIDKK